MIIFIDMICCKQPTTIWRNFWQGLVSGHWQGVFFSFDKAHFTFEATQSQNEAQKYKRNLW